MNSKELGIFISLRNTPETCRITDNGTKFYTLVNNQLVCFEGEDIDKMGGRELYDFFIEKLREYNEAQM